MSEKCFWCNKNANQLNKIEIKFRGKLKESKICSPDCEVKLRRLSEYADTHIKYYILGLTLSFLIGLVVVFWRFNVDKGALGVLIILAGAGLTLIKYPFVTSQSVSLMGAKKAIAAGRILGMVNIILGIVFWLIVSQYYLNEFNLANYVANNSSSMSRNYCQQDSDCVLTPQYQGCCPKECETEEAVNIETKNIEEESRNKLCGTKDYICPTDDCQLNFYTNQAVCEQNRCVVKEKLVTESQSTINGLQFSINSDKTVYQYKKDEPITIHGEFKNITGKNIYFYTPETTPTVTYEVFDTKRKKIEIPSVIADPRPSAKEDFVLVRPNESLTKVFKLYLGIEEEVFVPGIYSVAVIYNNNETGYYVSSWSGKIKSNFIEIDIKAGNKNLNQSNLKNYKVIGSYTSPGESSFVKVLNDTVFLTDISEGLLAIDVSNPEKPVLLDKIKIGNGGAYALAIEPNGPFAVVGGYGNTKVALVDIIDPKNLRIVNEIDAKRTVQDMTVVANNVYLAIDGPEIEVLELISTFDDTTETFPELTVTRLLISKGVFQIQGGGHAIGTVVLDINIGDLLTHNLIIAQGESGVGVYEKAEFVMPRFSFVSKVGYVSVVDADKNYVYAGVGNGIKVIDLKTQKEIADIKVDDVWNFKVKDRTLYVASGENGIKVLDISDIKNPKQIAIIDTPGRARSIDVSADGKYIYVADDRDDLQIIGLQ